MPQLQPFCSRLRAISHTISGHSRRFCGLWPVCRRTHPCAASSESARVLAQRHGITEQTVYKWKKRDSVHDRSHTAHHLQTQLTPAQEIVVVHLRRALLLPLDDLLAVTREFICETVSRSGLPPCLAQGLPDPDHQSADRQRQGVHRSPVCQPRARAQRPA